MNNKIQEAVHSLNWGPVDPLLLCAQVHYQLLCLADIQEDMVLLAPLIQAVILLQVDLLVIIGDQAHHIRYQVLSANTVISVI